MLEKKKLDIVIPVYNEGELIIDTLNSIKDNLKCTFNILICYDIDNDNTLQAIDKSLLDKSNIFYVKNKFTGAHGAVMSGIKKTLSEIVLVIPADDNYNTPRIQNMYEMIVDENIDVLCPDRFIERNSIIDGPFIKFMIVRIVNFTLYSGCKVSFCLLQNHIPITNAKNTCI